jgi:hypothetical protein
MDCQFWWWFIIYLIIFYFNSIESRNLLNSNKEKNESTNKNQTSKKSTNHVLQYQSIFSTNLASITTTIRSTNIIQTFITKPNSYLYNPDEDEEILLDRVKREPAPFVCKGKIFFILIIVLVYISLNFLADGYFPDRQNCRIYHICTSGVDTASVCGEGTAWDPIKKNCGWENTVECKKGLRKWDQITDIRGGKKKWIIRNSRLKIFFFLEI